MTSVLCNSNEHWLMIYKGVAVPNYSVRG